MGIEQMIYHDMMMNGEDVLVGSVEALKHIGIIIDEKSLCQYSNNYNKRCGIQAQRKVE